ncbi:hypothetical protein [Gordonia sp. (in: high G+C Gram-positive bacteria)]|uniref:hypothetical protein n=1 Tax=Gordonia sp. (in: high G+C Gram-positive bacteria) TaxID=84139 RepID=UPI0033422BE4
MTTPYANTIHDIVIGDIDDFERIFRDELDRCQICDAARSIRAAREAAKWGSLHPARPVAGSPAVLDSAECRRAADVVEKLTGDATSSVSATDLREEADGMDAAETLARRRNDAITRVKDKFLFGEGTAAAIVALVTDVMDGVTR